MLIYTNKTGQSPEVGGWSSEVVGWSSEVGLKVDRYGSEVDMVGSEGVNSQVHSSGVRGVQSSHPLVLSDLPENWVIFP